MKKTTALLATLLATTWAVPASAQEVTCDDTSTFPCSTQLESVRLAKVPSVFKFQARVSQAKLPLGQAVFDEVIVRLLAADTVLCQEKFANVEIHESVLNLEIGRHMDCELDEMIAEHTALAFQVCLGGPESCLKAIALGASPYAVKSSFASVAQNADSANTATQAHYAHRVTADRDMFLLKRLGTGYFDFYTHEEADSGGLFGGDSGLDYADYEDGGFIQWTPVRDRGAKVLNVVAKDQGTDTLSMLNELLVHAEDARFRGNVNGDGDLTIAGIADLAGSTIVQASGVEVTGQLDVSGATAIGGLLTSASGLGVTGDAVVEGTLSTKDGFAIQSGGNVEAAVDVVAGQNYRIGPSVVMSLDGETAVIGEGGDVTGVRVPKVLTGTENVTFEKDLQVNGTLGVGSVVTFDAEVIFNGGTTNQAQAADNENKFVNQTGEADPVTINNTLNVTGTTTLAGLNVSGTSTHGSLNVTTSIANSGGTLLLNDAVRLAQTTTFGSTANPYLVVSETTIDARKPIRNGGTSNSGFVVIDDVLTVNEQLTAHKSAAFNQGISVTGPSTIGGEMFFLLPIHGPATQGLTVDDDLIVTGDITDGGAGAVKISDDLVVTGTLSDDGGALAIEGDVTITGTLSNPGSDHSGQVLITDTLKVRELIIEPATGKARLTGNAPSLPLLYMNKLQVEQDLYIGSSGQTSYLATTSGNDARIRIKDIDTLWLNPSEADGDGDGKHDYCEWVTESHAEHSPAPSGGPPTDSGSKWQVMLCPENHYVAGIESEYCGDDSCEPAVYCCQFRLGQP